MARRTVTIQVSPPETISLEEATDLINEKIIPEMQRDLPKSSAISSKW